jgi:hypothetical protein
VEGASILVAWLAGLRTEVCVVSPAACALMAFGFAEAAAVGQVLNRITVRRRRLTPRWQTRSEQIVRSGFTPWR